MQFSNKETRVFNMHHRDDVMAPLLEKSSVTQKEAEEEIEILIESILETVEKIDGFLFDIVHGAMEKIRREELAAVYLNDLRKEEE